MKKIVTLGGSLLLLLASTAWAAVNVNTATVEELTKLEGIGQSRAEAVVKYREEHAGFESKQELLKVEGIGDATLKKISDDITLGPDHSKK